MPKVEFGFIMPADNLRKECRDTYVVDLRRATELVEGHYSSAWAIDHLQFGDTDVMEGYTLLAYMAALHPTLRFGNIVMCQSFRNPALVARMGATLQFMSGGRFILGIGAGWHEEEYNAYGYPFPPDGVRVDQLAEALQIIRVMWTQSRTTFEGRYYKVHEASCEPKPDPIPPIIVGAFRPRMMRITAQYADGWNVSSTGPGEYARLREQFNRICEGVGRDPGTVERSWAGGCVCAPTEARAKSIAGDRYSTGSEEDFDFVGTPEQVIAQMQPFIDMGVTQFMLDCGGFPDTTTLELLVGEVLPALSAE
jgi:alkanesulfonate monooxygenase SsuD/methylene tetrahydromethanopterin reductase-like flavin-dependent oxidoreductase (luciferase family)